MTNDKRNTAHSSKENPPGEAARFMKHFLDNGEHYLSDADCLELGRFVYRTDLHPYTLMARMASPFQIYLPDHLSRADALRLLHALGHSAALRAYQWDYRHLSDVLRVFTTCSGEPGPRVLARLLLEFVEGALETRHILGIRATAVALSFLKSIAATSGDRELEQLMNDPPSGRLFSTAVRGWLQSSEEVPEREFVHAPLFVTLHALCLATKQTFPGSEEAAVTPGEAKED